MGDDGKVNSKSIVPNKISVFGLAPILEGEDEQAYNELLMRVSGDVKPTDIIEEIWIREVVDLRWEIFRWRRLKTVRLSRAVLHSLSNRLATIMRRESKKTARATNILVPPSLYKPTPPSTDKLMKKWAAGDPAAVDRVNKLIASANVTMDLVRADALIEKLDEIERIDHLIAIAEGRCNSIFREIDRHRAALAENLRRSVKDIEDGEFEIVEPAEVSVGKKVA